MKEVNIVEGKKRLVADGGDKVGAIMLAVLWAGFCALILYISRDGMTPALAVVAALLFGGSFLACIFFAISKFTDYIDVTDTAVYQHRFLLPDRSFRFDEITGMRFNHYSRDHERITLFIGGRRIFSVTRPDSGKPDFLWNKIVSENYPLKYYKGEDARHFTVGIHFETHAAVIAAAVLGTAAFFSLIYSGDTYGSFTEWLEKLLLPILAFIPFLLLLERISNLRIRIDGDTVRAGRLFLRKHAHISELYCAVNTRGLSPVPELRFRDGSRRFAKIYFWDVENLLALKKYLSDHGLSCKGFPEL